MLARTTWAASRRSRSASILAWVPGAPSASLSVLGLRGLSRRPARPQERRLPAAQISCAVASVADSRACPPRIPRLGPGGPAGAARDLAATRTIRSLSTVGGEGDSEEPVERETLPYDVCIVGAGPAGLAAAIRIRQLCKETGEDVSVCVLEKGAEVGAHTLSGNVFETRALDELLPGWRDDPSCPIAETPVSSDSMRFLTATGSVPLPHAPGMSNRGNYVISLSRAVRWLGEKAEALGADVFPGFSAASLAVGRRGERGAGGEGGDARPEGAPYVRGVVTKDAGVGRDGRRKATFAPGVVLEAELTLLAEGCRGSLSEEAARTFGLREGGGGALGSGAGESGRAGPSPQTYALGIKEVWEVPEAEDRPGSVLHTVGWPLRPTEYGGGFVYHLGGGKVAVGLVIGLDYADPFLEPFREFQKWKTHPIVARALRNGKPLQYGARTLVEGGLQAVPRLVFPGGALLGDSAGLLNVPKIKGTHTAMKSGELAGREAFEAVLAARRAREAAPGDAPPPPPIELDAYPTALAGSWVRAELEAVRNVRPGFATPLGIWGGLVNAGLETAAAALGARTPWTLRHRGEDRAALRPLVREEAEALARGLSAASPGAPARVPNPRAYPPPNGELTFDLPTSLYRSSTNHEHDQPSHLVPIDRRANETVGWERYGGPEARYCPAGVYTYESAPRDEDGLGGDAAEPVSSHASLRAPRVRLAIAAQNCLHCKACDIKDPTGSIRWTVPEGGGGPGYTLM